MAQIPCKFCGEMISDQVAVCPKCGAPVEQVAKPTVDTSKVDMFISLHGKEFPEIQLPLIREKLLKMGNDKLTSLSMLQFKNPTTILIVSIFLGELGIDRFMIGKTGTGILKLITLGGFGLWWLIDLFLISEKTKQWNFQKLSTVL